LREGQLRERRRRATLRRALPEPAMRANLTPDIELAARLFDALRGASFDGVGVTRDAYGPGEQRAHDLVPHVIDFVVNL
jgi:hypothetical protein